MSPWRNRLIGFCALGWKEIQRRYFGTGARTSASRSSVRAEDYQPTKRKKRRRLSPLGIQRRKLVRPEYYCCVNNFSLAIDAPRNFKMGGMRGRGRYGSLPRVDSSARTIVCAGWARYATIICGALDKGIMPNATAIQSESMQHF